MVPVHETHGHHGTAPGQEHCPVRTEKHTTAHVGHDAHAGHHMADFLTAFWVTLALTAPIVLYSDLPELFFGWRAPAFAGSSFLPLLFGSIVFFYGGSVFIKGAWSELRARLPGMMTLIALAIIAAYVYSVGSFLFGDGAALFWELSTLIVIMLLGHYVEMRAVTSAKGALRELAQLLPDSAEVLRGEAIVVVPLAGLREGDRVLVRPGGKVPADGLVAEGESEMDESVITGESRPALKRVGDTVIAGSINGDGALTISVEKIGEHTFLAGIMRLVAEAEKSKSRLQLLSDRAAFYLTMLAVAAGAVTFVVWLAVGESLPFAIERLVAVLVIACPHALGLAIPLVASISTTMASKAGFFVKRRLALEAARGITTVLFDKTGTLTKGAFGVIAVLGEGKTLSLAAQANALSEHPIGRAITARAASLHLDIPRATSFVNVRGKGVQAEIGASVLVGSALFLQEKGITLPNNNEILTHEREGKTVIHVARQGNYVGSVVLADVLRDESREAVRALKDMGIRVAMITGDSDDVAAWVARELSIDEYFARVLPGEKAETVRELQARGEKVAMVGDGVNDAPALMQADLGIAIGAGTNVAIESAGIILVKNDPRDIPKIVRLSRMTYAKMIQNLFWATGYNLAALPIAAGALALYGIVLEPAVAAIFMSLSTVIVAINATLLRRKTL